MSPCWHTLSVDLSHLSLTTAYLSVVSQLCPSDSFTSSHRCTRHRERWKTDTSEDMFTQQKWRSKTSWRSSHKQKQKFLYVCHSSPQILHIFLPFLSLMFLFFPPSLVRVGVFSTESSRSQDWRQVWSLVSMRESNLSVTSPSRAVTFKTHTCNPRHSSLPVLLCNVNGWLLFTLITASRCVSIWSLQACRRGLIFEDMEQVRFTKQIM